MEEGERKRRNMESKLKEEQWIKSCSCHRSVSKSMVTDPMGLFIFKRVEIGRAHV